MKFIVDKITNGVARLEAEDKSFVEVSCKFLPKIIKEGDVLLVTEDEALTITVDERATAGRAKLIKKYMDELWED
ncbi:MAG: DUF3006 domain-containing protein [Cellulosilyticaceae bacterium]